MNRQNDEIGRAVIAGLLVGSFIVKFAFWTLIALVIVVGVVAGIAVVQRARTARSELSSGLRTPVIHRRHTIVR